uniref:Histocompatibility (minor) 13 n=1 Tax=Gadus morhua TaxID=8049 RepID=A0A8C5CXB2_GADMO
MADVDQGSVPPPDASVPIPGLSPDAELNGTDVLNATAAKFVATPEGTALAYGSLLFMALLPIFFGALRSVTCSKSKNSSDMPETITGRDAARFPIIASCTLFGLYLFFKVFSQEYINLLLSMYFFVLGILALAHTLSPLMAKVFPASIPIKQYQLLFTQGSGEAKEGKDLTSPPSHQHHQITPIASLQSDHYIIAITSHEFNTITTSHDCITTIPSPPSRHHHHVTTITSPPSCHHHHVTTITSPPSRHHHHVTTITSPPSRHHHHVTTITSPPSRHYHHVTTITSPPSRHYHHVTTIMSPPSRHYHHVTTITSPPSRHHHHVTTITSPPSRHHHHVTTITSPPSRHHHHITTSRGPRPDPPSIRVCVYVFTEVVNYEFDTKDLVCLVIGGVVGVWYVLKKVSFPCAHTCSQRTLEVLAAAQPPGPHEPVTCGRVCDVPTLGHQYSVVFVTSQHWATSDLLCL